MSQTAVLEREPRTTASTDQSPEAIAHNRRGSEIYSKLFSPDVTDEELVKELGAGFPTPSAAAAPVREAPMPVRETPVRETVRESLPSTPVREPSYTRFSAPEVEYTDHRLRSEDVTPTGAAAPVSAPSNLEEENEDSRPTRRTMETLQRSVAYSEETQVQEHVGFFASLSNTARLVLALVAVAIVVAIALICINTGIINSLNANIDERRSELEGLSEYSRQLNEEIDRVSSDDYVDAYAENVLNMTRP